MTRVLVTAFEPFGGETINPSQQAAQRLAEGPAIDAVELATAGLPVVFGAALDALRKAVAEHDPDVVICAGQAGGRYAVTPERVAVNVNDTPMADNAGNAPIDQPVVDGGPVAYLTGLPVNAIVSALHEAAIPAEVSWTAGTYVCNHVFYGLMHLIANERPHVRGGFVHVPYAHEQVLTRTDAQPSLALDTITEALRVAIATTISTTDGRDVTAATGPAPTP